MSFCKQCGNQIGNEEFCGNCGEKLENLPNDNRLIAEGAKETSSVIEKRKKDPRNKTTITILGMIVLVCLAVILYFAFDMRQVSNEGLGEVESSVQNKELVEMDTSQYTVKDLDVLEAVKNGNLMSSLHLGKTKDELISLNGEPIKEYAENEEIYIAYPDAIYTMDPKNGLIYSTTLKPAHAMKYNFKEIKNLLGDGDEHVVFEQGKDEYGLYYLAYGTEDSSLVFYSPTEEGRSVVEITYGNASILSSELEVREETPSIHPSEMEPIILEIRREYSAINDHIQTMTKTESVATDGQKEQDFKNAQGTMKKIIKTTGKGGIEYYYNDAQEVLFIFTYEGTIENRYYFHDNQMVRWIDSTKKTIDYDEGQGNRAYKDWEKRWIEKAY